MRIYNYYDYGKNKANMSAITGNKAVALFQNMKNTNIPKFCVLGTSLLTSLLSLPKNLAIRDRLTEIWACKTNLILSAPEIKSLFKVIKIPSEWKDELEQYLSEHDIKAPFAVRSSSVFEDNSAKSAAGMFSSFLNVSKDNLWDSILACLCSTLMPNALNIMEHDPGDSIFSIMAVIIQEMVECDMSGVAFTVHPLNPDKGMLVEYMHDGGSVTDGKSAVCSVIIKDNILRDVKEEDSIWLNNLIEIVRMIRKNNPDTEYDIEWGIRNHVIYIFQIRPITAISFATGENRLIEICDVGILSEQDLLSLSGKYKSWRYKKAPLYSACRDLGIRTLRWYIIIATDEQGLQKLVQEAVDKIKSEYVLLMYNNIIIDCVIKSGDVIQYLTSILQSRKNRSITCSIREMRDNTSSAISYYDVNTDTVLIEALPGSMKGLKSGLDTPARYITTKETILESSIPHIDRYFSFNIVKNVMEEKKFDCHEILLQEHAIQIYLSTKELYFAGIKGALELWICDGKPIVTDVSLNETNKKQSLIENEVSPGPIVGCVIEIMDTSDMEELSYSNAVSVNNYEPSLTSITKIVNNLEKIRELKQQGFRVVVKIEKPFLAMIPVLEEADGVIFKEASILCHTSIILREKRIPAIAVGEVYGSICEGDEIRL